MKVFIFFIFTALVCAKDIKVATYNVDNLFDLTDNKSEYKEYVPNTHNWTKAILEKKIAHLTQVICEVNADVIGLQEIENENALHLLQEHLQKSGCKYPYAAITHKIGSSIQVALLSKIPLKQKRSLRVSFSPADRDILEVELKTNPSLTIFVNHWRSKRAPESQRLKYAKVLKKRLLKMPKEKEYIILGDFNSEYNECSKLKKEFNDTNGTCGIDQTLQTIYQGRLIRLNQKVPLSFYLYNLWSEMPAHKRWSHDQYGLKEAIDSIIIPPTLLDNKGWHYKKGSFKVFKKAYLFKKYSMLNRWEIKNGKHTGKGFSDHLPLVAVFSNNEPTPKKYETWIDKLWQLIFPKVTEKSIKEKEAIKLDFSKLYFMKHLKNPVILENVCLIFKRGDIGVIKKSPTSYAITLYKSADGMQEGQCYDLKIYKKINYYGLEEITQLDIIKKREKIDIEQWIKTFDLSRFKKKYLGDIVKNIEGIYKRGYLFLKDGSKIKLYFKGRKKGLLKKGNQLFIKKAQISRFRKEWELKVFIDDVFLK